MEITQTIETKLIRAGGERLRLDYRLFWQEEPRLPPAAYGLEVALGDARGGCSARYDGIAEGYREAVSLIHVLAARCALPRAMKLRLQGEGTGQPGAKML